MSMILLVLFFTLALAHLTLAFHTEDGVSKADLFRNRPHHNDIHVLFDNLLTVERKEKNEGRFHLQHGIRKYESVPVEKHLLHQVIFAVKQRNTHKLQDILISVSDPTSPEYGKYWSREQIGVFTRNKRAAQMIEKTLAHHGIAVDSVTLYDEYITASATIEKWEEFFQTQFCHFHDDVNDKVVVRAVSHSLPLPLDPLISGVFGVSDYFLDRSGHSKKRSKNFLRNLLKTNEIKLDTALKAEGDSFYPTHGNNGAPWCVYPKRDTGGTVQLCLVYPQLLHYHYNSSNPYGNMLASQALFASTGQLFSPADLKLFQDKFDLMAEPITSPYNDLVFYDACSVDNGDNCDEASLEIQHVMAMAQNVSTHFDSVGYESQGDLLLGWILSVVNMTSPVDVFSIIFGGYEAFSDINAMISFNTEAMKLGIQGVTIINSSGDDGAVNAAEDGYCNYYPTFPSVSMYVTSVGATQGPEEGKPEVTCQIPNAGITSGGGFSSATTLYNNTDGYFNYVPINPIPYWQENNVKNYLLKEPNLAPGFASGRGYPDISMLGNNYFVPMNGSFVPLSGTLASALVFAGVVSQANSFLKSQAKSTLGFLNPLLYQYAEIFVRDVTVGENNCASAYNTRIANGTFIYDGYCCEEGFVATAGWDPVTGLGSLDVDLFLMVAENVSVKNVPSMSSSNAPTQTSLMSLVQGPSISGGIIYFALDGSGDYVVSGNNNAHDIYSANASSIEAFVNMQWQPLLTNTSQGLSSVVVDVSGTNVVVGGADVVYYTRDGGRTWNVSTISSGYSSNWILIASSSDNRVVLLSDCGPVVWISYDYGASFNAQVVVYAIGEVIAVGVSATGNTLVIGGLNGVNCSNDGGVTWHGNIAMEMFQTLLPPLVSDELILIGYQESSVLYASTDGGHTFSPRYSNLMGLWSLASDATLSCIVALQNGESGFVVSTNGGFSFEPLIMSPNAASLYYSIQYGIEKFQVDQDNATTMVLITNTGDIFRGTIVWNSIATAFPTFIPSVAPTTMNPTSYPSISPLPTSPTISPTHAPTPMPTLLTSLVQGPSISGGIIYFALDGTGDYVVGVKNDAHDIYSANASSTEAFVNMQWQPLLTNTKQDLSSVAVDVSGTNVVVAGANVVYYTRDGGRTWSESIISFEYSSNWTVIASSSDNRVVLLSDYSPLAWISYDYGASFNAQVVDYTIEQIRVVGVSATGNTLVIGGLNGVNCSNDGGVTWHGIIDMEMFEILPPLVSDELILIGSQTNNVLYASTDGGHTFSLRNSHLMELWGLASDATLSRIVALQYGEPGFVVSTNGGFSFEPLIMSPTAAPLFYSIQYGISYFQVDQDNATTMVLITNTGDIFRGTIAWNSVATAFPTFIPSVAPTTMNPTSYPSISPLPTSPTISPTYAPTPMPTLLTSLVQGPSISGGIIYFALDGSGDYVVSGTTNAHDIYSANASSTEAFVNMQWQPLLTNTKQVLSSVAVDVSGTNVVVGGANVVYYTRDGGRTWNVSTISSGYSSNWNLIASSSDNRVVLLSDHSTVAWISYDYGASFNAQVVVYAIEEVTAVGVSATGNTLVIGGDNGVNCSNDGGVTWHGNIAMEMFQTLLPPLVSDELILIGYQDNNVLYASTDGGHTFSLRNSHLMELWGLASDATLSRIVALQYGESGIVVSTNGGFSFEPLIISPTAAPLFYSIQYGISYFQVDQDNATTMVLITNTGDIFRGTIAWNSIATAFPTFIPSVAPMTNPTLYPSISPLPTSPTICGTTFPTLIPSSETFAVPSMFPIISPTESPLVFESGAPTIASTISPTRHVTYISTHAPSPIPSVIPSLSPSVLVTTSTPTMLVTPSDIVLVQYFVKQTFLGISYSTYSSNMASNNIVIQQTTASILSLQQSNIQITAIVNAAPSLSFPVDGSNNLRSRREIISSIVAVNITYSVTIPNIYAAGYQSPSDAYLSSWSLLSTAVVTGSYTTELQAIATDLAIEDLTSVSSDSATVSDSFTTSSTTSSSSDGQKRTFEISNYLTPVILSIFTVFMMFTSMVIANHIRAQTTDDLSGVDSIWQQSLNTSLKAISWVSFWFELNSITVQNAPSLEGVDLLVYIGLVLSRIPTIVGWVLFLFMLFRPSEFNIITWRLSEVPIKLLLSRSCLDALVNQKFWIFSLSSFFSVQMIGLVFDISQAKYLPWMHSKVSDELRGYPSHLVMQVTLYPAVFSALLQMIFSLILYVLQVEKALRTSDDDTATSPESILNLLFFISSTMAALMFSLEVFALSMSMKTKNSHFFTVSVDGILMGQNNIPTVDSSTWGKVLMQEDGTPSEQDEERYASTVNPMAMRESLPTAPMEESKTTALPANRTEEEFKENELQVAAAEANIDILMRQLRGMGVRPLRYMPLATIRRELQEIFDKMNTGQSYDEGALDFLLACLEINPEYIQEQDILTKKWREEIQQVLLSSWETMRSFVPPEIFSNCSESKLRELGLPAPLAKRIWNKRTLWLLRLQREDIEKMHEVDLMTRYNPIGAGLDLVEFAAVYACLPSSFANDGTGKKEVWRLQVQKKLKELLELKGKGSLNKAQLRHPTYKDYPDNILGPFSHRQSLFSLAQQLNNEVPAVPMNVINGAGTAVVVSANNNQNNDDHNSFANPVARFRDQFEKLSPPTTSTLLSNKNRHNNRLPKRVDTDRQSVEKEAVAQNTLMSPLPQLDSSVITPVNISSTVAPKLQKSPLATSSTVMEEFQQKLKKRNGDEQKSPLVTSTNVMEELQRNFQKRNVEQQKPPENSGSEDTAV